MGMKYSEILKANNSLSHLLNDEEYNICIFSNIITSQINEILEFTLRQEHIPARVESGDYDNILQDSQTYCDYNLIIIFWELCNMVEGFQSKAELLNREQLDLFIDKTKSEIDFVLKNLKNTSLILINQFTSLPFHGSAINNTQFD